MLLRLSFSREPAHSIGVASSSRSEPHHGGPERPPSGLNGPVGYLPVADIEQRLKELPEASATVQQPPRDVGGGKLIATVRDADGNVTGLMQG
jgi:predicted enzyme related to lactoylglutathione lyase